MPRRLVLLTGPFEAGLLVPFLQSRSLACLVQAVETLAALEAVIDQAPGETRLLAFCTSVIVPLKLLDRLPGPAYNIHPGPPTHPGRHPESWGAYDGVGRFGATLHEMAPLVDAGPIVDVLWFDVPPGAGQIAYGMGALRAGLELVRRWSDALVGEAALPRSDMSWSGRKTTHAELEAMCRIPADLDPAEIERRRRAFAEQEGSVLTLTVAGLEFRWVAPAPPQD